MNDVIGNPPQTLLGSQGKRRRRARGNRHENRAGIDASAHGARVRPRWVFSDAGVNHFLRTSKSDVGDVIQEVSIYRVSLAPRFIERPERHRHVMARCASPLLHPGAAFGLQISDRPLDRMLDLDRFDVSLTDDFAGLGKIAKANSQNECRDTTEGFHGRSTLRKTSWTIGLNGTILPWPLACSNGL